MRLGARVAASAHAWAAPALVALVAALPFAPGLLRGESLYFRDLSRQFIPLRLFALEGLQQGELRFWDPYVHEGEPMSLPPVSYPLDLLQLLAPRERGISASLALHVPAAALAFFALCRGLGLGQGAACGGALAYALGGFTLSTLNLYVYVQAVAWAPLVALGLLRAAQSAAGIAPAAVACAVAISTTGIEIVGQSLLLGLVIAAPGRSLRSWLRAAAAIALGVGLAAPVIAVVAGLLRASARAEGFPVSVVLAHSIHPLTFVQTAIAGLYCDLADPVNSWWGSNFFPKGFPYFVSLYLGATVVSLAAVGLRGNPLARRLAVLACVAAVVCLGRWAHLSTIVELVPALQALRFPSKAFFTVHTVAALLTALGLDVLGRGDSRAWRALAAAALGSGSALCALLLAPALLPQLCRWFAAGFFPPEYAVSMRMALLGVVLSDAAKGGSIAILAGLVALSVVWRRIRSALALLLLAALASADLLRAGTGINRTVDPALLRPSPEVQLLAADLRREGGRFYAPDMEASPAQAEARRLRPGSHELWSFAVLVDTATPFLNVGMELPSALTIDTTMLVPTERVIPPERSGPDAVRELLPQLRNAGVAHVLSLDPLDVEGLGFRAVLEPQRIAPLRLHVYRVSRPLPLRALATRAVPARTGPEARAQAEDPGFQESGGVAVEGMAEPVDGARGRLLSWRERPGRIEAEVESDRPSVLFVREAFAPGWSATVEGEPRPVLRANGRHCAVAVPAGRSHVALRFEPARPVWAAGAALASVAVIGLLWASSTLPRFRRHPEQAVDA